jgi:SAM-dependent methyltransferase
MKDSEQNRNWDQQVASTYTSRYLAESTLKQRKNWYSAVADAYNQTRPRYPQELISRAAELSQLPAAAMILEVGCGPGIATTAFAQLGFGMVCLEPSQAACQLAQQNCQQYPNVEIKNTTFEEWELEVGKFHAVLAATAWHWVKPEIGYPKAAATLKDKGSLILLWNMTPQPPYEVYQELNQVYQIHAPSLARFEERETQEKTLRGFGKNILDSGRFQNLVTENLPCEVTYTIDNYLLLLSTLSPYIVLEPQRRDDLFTDLRQVLHRVCNNGVQISYLSALQIAQKI